MKTNKFYIFSLIFAALTVFSVNAWGAVNNGDLFERVSSIAANDEIIFVNSGESVAMSTTQNNNNRGVTSITVDKTNHWYVYNSTNNVQVLTVSVNSSKYSFYTVNGSSTGYLQCPSNNNYLRTNSTLDDKTKWTYEVSSNAFTIKNASQTSRYIAYNSSNSIFSAYSSGQSKPYVFKKVLSAPTAVAASSITTNSATITITDATNVNKYEVYYSKSSTAPTASSSGTTGESKSINLTGLTAGTDYYVWARAYSTSPARKTGWVALTGSSFKTASVTTLSTTPTSITFDDNTVDVGTDEASLSVSLTNGYKSGGYYLYGWFDDESDVDHCTFYVNEAESYTYSSGTGTQNLSPTLTISYLADAAGTYTGNFYIQGYNASFQAVNCTIPLSVTLTAGCANEVTIAKNTESHATLSFSANSIKTCDETAANRQITVSVAPENCYVAPVAASVTTTGTAATQKSGPTWNGSTSKYDYVYEFAQNATGTTTFNVSISDKTTYAVSYNAGSTTYTSGNAISGSHANDTKTCGTDMTLPGATFTTTGYTQTGWATADGGALAHDLNIDDYDVDAAANLYPVWTAQQYAITYYDGDATSATKTFSGDHASGYPTQHTYGKATTLKGATKTGYTFGGWFDNKECTGEAVTSLGAKAYTAGMTLYAKWNAKSCTVEFDKQSGSGGSDDATVTYGEALPDITAPTRLHYIFQGYYDGEETKYYGADGKGVKTWDKDVTANTTLYAHWTEHSYTNYRTLCCNEWDAPELTYSTSISASGTTTISIGDGAYGDVTFVSNDKDVLTVDENGVVTGVAAGATTVTITWEGDATHCEKSVTTNAITVVGNVTVIFHANNGTEETMDNQSIPVNEATTLSANEFSSPSTCKYFYGWATSQELADAGTLAYEDEEEVTITEGMNLYAIWKTYRYTIATPTKVGAATATLDYSEVDCNGEVTVTSTADASHKGDPTITITPSDAGTVNGNKIQNIVKNITAVTVTYTAKEVYTVTWKVGNVALEGDALTGVTTSVTEGNGIEHLPANPSGTTLSGADTFMGWSKSELSGLGNGAPSDLFTEAGDEPDIDGNVTYHAVFATKNTGGEMLTKQGSTATFSAGDKLVIVATSGDDVLAAYQETSGTNYVKNWSFDNSAATVKADSKKSFALEAGTTNWKLGDGTNGYLYNASSNDLAVSTENATEYSISWNNTESKFTLYGNSRYLSCRSDLTGGNKNLYRMSSNTTTGIVYFDIYKYTVTPTTYSNYITKVVALDHIAISAEAGKTIKTVYKKGETLDLTNMVVTATYADATSRAVTGYTVEPTTSTALTNETKFTVSYTEGAVTKTAEQAIKVYELSGIEITAGPTTTTYKSGATLSTAGMEVTATWGGSAADAFSEVVTGYTVDLSTNLATTDTEFEVSYTHENVTKTATKAINVCDLSSISITNVPDKISYTAGEVFDPAGMVVKAVWGSNDIVENDQKGYTYSEEPLVNDGDVAANVDVTISYTSNGVTKTATQVVTVAPKAKKIMTWHVANTSSTTRIYENAQGKYILAFPDDPDPVAAGFTSDYVFKGWTTATSVKKDGSDFSKATAGTEMDDDEDFYAVFALASEEETTILSQNFNTCSGTGGNDDRWSGSIATSEIPTLTPAWSFTNANAAYQCIKAGTGKAGGSVTTPSLTLNGATATITFKAAAWDGSSEGTSLSVSASAGTLKSGNTTVSSVTIKKGEWDNYTLTLTGVTSSATVTFSTGSGNKRFFLDEVVVTAPATTYSNYRLVPSAVKKPTISLEEGTYYGAQTVTLSQEDSKPIYYTLNGSNPTNESTLYSSAISLNEAGTKTLKAVAWDATATDYSLIASAEYTIVTEIAAPTMTAAQTFYGENMNVEISHALSTEEGFNLQYSYDGESWTNYTSALTINETKTVYAKATIGTLMSEANATYTKGVTVGYTKITTDAEMAIGMKFIIASGNDAAGSLSSNYLNGVELSNALNTGTTKYITNEAVVVFELGGRSGKYTLTSEGKKLSSAGSSSIGYDGGWDKWNITFSAAVPTIKNNNYADYALKYNSNYTRFSMYSAQTAVDIFVEPFTAHTLTIKNYDGSDKLTAKVVEGGSFVLTNDDKPNGYPATYVFLNKWTDGTNTYAVGDAVPMGDANVELNPCWKVTPTANTDINDLPTSVTEIVVTDGKTLEISAGRSLDNLTVEAGGKVNFDNNTEHTLTVNALTIEMEIMNNDDEYAPVDGKSGQVMDASKVTASAVYMDVRFYSKNDATELGAGEANVWYSISAPFDVNLNGGFIDIASGEPMEFGQDFDLFEYDGYKRATTGVTGWKRAQGKMNAGVACLIGFNESQPTTIRLKAASNTLSNPTTIDLKKYTCEIGDEENRQKHSNWNGVANPTLHYTTLDKDAQYFNNNTRGWETCTKTDYSFVVGTAFFVHSDVDIELSNTINGTLRAPQRNEGEIRYEYGVRITSTTDKYSTSNMFVRASEDAEAGYQAGHDLQTMNDETAPCALIYAKNYGTRLAIEEAPMVNSKATYELGIFAPSAGTYTISVAAPKENATLYLTKNGRIYWNLTMGACELDLNQGQNNEYGLVLRAEAPAVTTGVEQSVFSDQYSDVQKVIIDEHVYILRGGEMYDMTGKAVK